MGTLLRWWWSSVPRWSFLWSQSPSSLLLLQRLCQWLFLPSSVLQLTLSRPRRSLSLFVPLSIPIVPLYSILLDHNDHHNMYNRSYLLSIPAWDLLSRPRMLHTRHKDSLRMPADYNT